MRNPSCLKISSSPSRRENGEAQQHAAARLGKPRPCASTSPVRT